VSWVSVCILGYMGLGALSGLRRGLVLVAFSVAGYVAGLFAASRYDEVIVTRLVHWRPFAHWINRHVGSSTHGLVGRNVVHAHWLHAVLGVLVFLVVIAVAEGVGRAIGQTANQAVRGFRLTGFFNRVGGLAAGAIENGLVASVILGLLLTFPLLQHVGWVNRLDRNSVVGLMLTWYHRLSLSPAGRLL
jgi:uncharacterized membrane protein required for colicin V production